MGQRWAGLDGYGCIRGAAAGGANKRQELPADLAQRWASECRAAQHTVKSSDAFLLRAARPWPWRNAESLA